MGRVLTEPSTLTLAPESSFGAQPTTGWVQVQPNPGGIKRWQDVFTTVARDPLSVYATMEAGDVVGFDATPEIDHDLNVDWLDLLASAMFRSTPEVSGNTGVALFRPTAVTSTGYTVAASGALTQGLLVYANGFPTLANNGLKLVGASSTNLEIKASGLVAESVAATLGATLKIAGVQGATGDIEIDADGNLISTTLDFTTLNIAEESWIKIGGATSATQFATAAYNRSAQVESVTTNLITLNRRNWTVGAADDGTGKTIQVFFGYHWFRNVSLDDTAKYREPTLHGELTMLGAGPSGVSSFTNAKGMALKTFTINAPIESKITTTASFVAKDVRDPVLAADRATGAATPRRPMAARLFHTASPQLVRCRLAVKSSDASLVAEVNSWTFTMEHDISPREVQGEMGPVDLIYGKYKPSVSLEAYFTTYELAAAMRSYPDCTFDVQGRNDQGGWVLDMPCVKANSGDGPQFAANDAVRMSLDVPGYRDPTTSIVAALTLFAYLPPAP
jgi:hypothetical protein